MEYPALQEAKPDQLTVEGGEQPKRSMLAQKIVEECAELIHAICKAEKYGWNNHHPDTPTIFNRRNVLTELEHVIEACTELKSFFWHDLD